MLRAASSILVTISIDDNCSNQKIEDFNTLRVTLNYYGSRYYETMAKPALNNCDADAYRWLSRLTIEWLSTDMIPVGAFSPEHADIYLMFNKNYTHSIDNSCIPSSIRIYVHYSRAKTGPASYPYYLWSEVQSISIKASDRFPYGGYCVEGSKLYVLPVKKDQNVLNYYSRGTNGAYLPIITPPEQQEPLERSNPRQAIAPPKNQEYIAFDEQESMMLIGSCDGAAKTDDWC